VCARDGRALVGFANVVWDGSAHAILLDVVVEPDRQRTGVGASLVAMAVGEARAAGCEWLHVDFEDHLRRFYLDGCGFGPASAGLVRLTGD
jgi:GNAT superfamily N-acetyltransferase